MIRCGRKLYACCLALAVAWTLPVFALTFDMPKDGAKLIGAAQNVQLQDEDYPTIAQRYDIGYYELFEANPGINQDSPEEDTILVIPTQYILPAELHNNIVVNIAEMRLYCQFPKTRKVLIFPIGIGREGWSTPLGAFKVASKIVNPTWHVSAAIYKYRTEQGDKLDRIVPPGPDNPLGKYAMRLSDPYYLIHGTNDPVGIGRRSSAGCIRMYPEDIKQLFAKTAIGMEVQIINAPYKATIANGKIYFEAHMPLYEQRVLLHGDLTNAFDAVKKLGTKYMEFVDWSKVEQVAMEHLGLPFVVGELNIKQEQTLADVDHWTIAKEEMPDFAVLERTVTIIPKDTIDDYSWRKYFICKKYWGDE